MHQQHQMMVVANANPCCRFVKGVRHDYRRGNCWRVGVLENQEAAAGASDSIAGARRDSSPGGFGSTSADIGVTYEATKKASATEALAPGRAYLASRSGNTAAIAPDTPPTCNSTSVLGARRRLRRQLRALFGLEEDLPRHV